MFVVWIVCRAVVSDCDLCLLCGLYVAVLLFQTDLCLLCGLYAVVLFFQAVICFCSHSRLYATVLLAVWIILAVWIVLCR